MDNISITALMPMKENSERLPNKNIKLFNGKPLYQAVLSTLTKSKYIKEIIINTDIESILLSPEVHEKVKIIERPNNLRDDFVPFFDIIEYDMSLTSSNLFLQTHATNPILQTKTIDNAILEFYKNESCDSLLGVNKHNKRAYYSDKNPVNHDVHDKLLRTQDLEPIYIDSSCLYIFSRESFCKSENHRIGLNPHFFEMDEIESIDIDYEKDFLFAEMISKDMKTYFKKE